MISSNREFLFLTVFISGMTTLAIEFTCSRMLQTVYGTSNIVWANVIGLVLLFLTLGYFIGGRLADNNPNPKLFYWLICLAGFSSVLFLLLTSVLLKSTAFTLASLNVGAILGSLIGVCISIAIPITLLGCISPFAIRLGVRNVEEAGRVSGRIYAISTWGSLLGTYLPVLWVIPMAGSRWSAVIFGALLLIAGIIGLLLETRKISAAAFLPVILIPIVYIWTTGNIKNTPGQIFETESQYNYVEVVRKNPCNYLRLNEGQVVHSQYCDNKAFMQPGVWTHMLTAPYFNSPDYFSAHKEKPVESLMVIGLGAGTVPKAYMQCFGPMAVDGIEIDPTVVDVGRKYFAMNEPTLKVIVGDGRYELNKLKKTYDAVAIDAFKLPYIPWHLCTQEFFEEVKAHMNTHGVLAINVGRTPRDRRMVEAMTATLQQVFPSVHTIDADDLNTALIATVEKTSHQNYIENSRTISASTPPILVNALEKAGRRLVKTVASDVIFTDERAPVETITDSIVLNFVLGEG